MMDAPIPLSAYPDDSRLHVKCKLGTGRVYFIKPVHSNSGSLGYVGVSTATLAKRLSSHLAPKSKCIGLRNAIQLHGRDNFTIQVVEENVPSEWLDEREKYWVAKLDTHRNGYNCTAGGEANPMADANVRARHKVKMADPDIIARHVATRKKIFALPAMKKKLSKAHKKAWQNHDSKKKLADSMKAVWVDRDRKTLGKQADDRWADPAMRQKMVDAQKNAHKRPEVKAGKSNASKKLWADPEWATAMRAKLAAGRARAKERRSM